MSLPSTSASLLLALQDKGRNEAAWNTFHERYRGVLLRWCKYRGLSDEIAEDLTQEILLNLFLHLRRGAYDPARGRFRSWLKAVVNNAITDYLRRQGGGPEAAPGGTDFLEVLHQLASPESTDALSDALETQGRAVAARVEAVRSRVDESTWQAYYRTEIEERPVAEVAAELRLSVWAVYKNRARVREMLREEENR